MLKKDHAEAGKQERWLLSPPPKWCRFVCFALKAFQSGNCARVIATLNQKGAFIGILNAKRLIGAEAFVDWEHLTQWALFHEILGCIAIDLLVFEAPFHIFLNLPSVALLQNAGPKQGKRSQRDV